MCKLAHGPRAQRFLGWRALQAVAHACCRDNGAGLECTHFCYPSAPQLWLFMLYETLLKMQGQAAAPPAYLPVL